MSCGHCGAWVTISPGMSSSPVDSGWREYQQLSAEVLEKAAEDLSPRLCILPLMIKTCKVFQASSFDLGLAVLANWGGSKQMEVNVLSLCIFLFPSPTITLIFK